MAVEIVELVKNIPLISLHKVSVDDEEKALEVLKKYSPKEFH